MSRRCELTGVGVQAGNNVSHSNRKSRRRFLPNLQSVTLQSYILGQDFKLRITPATLRSIDHNGGLDAFLITAKSASLTVLGQKIRRDIKKAANKAPEEVKAVVVKPKAEKKPKAASKRKAKPKSESKKKAPKAKVAAVKKAKVKTKSKVKAKNKSNKAKNIKAKTKSNPKMKAKSKSKPKKKK